MYLLMVFIYLMHDIILIRGILSNVNEFILFKDKRKFEDNRIENSFNEGMVKVKNFLYINMNGFNLY